MVLADHGTVTPTRREAFRFWLKLGVISFGGPVAQIAIMHRELVDVRRWFDERTFMNALNFAVLIPGPEAMQLAVWLGWRLHGTWGGIVAGLCFLLPAMALLHRPVVRLRDARRRSDRRGIARRPHGSRNRPDRAGARSHRRGGRSRAHCTSCLP